MITLATYFVNKRYIHEGIGAKCIGETDSGSIKLLRDDGQEVWTTFDKLKEEVIELRQAA